MRRYRIRLNVDADPRYIETIVGLYGGTIEPGPPMTLYPGGTVISQSDIADKLRKVPFIAVVLDITDL